MSELYYSEDKLKRSIIGLLLKLQEADEKVTREETAYILKVAYHLGLDEADVTAIKADHRRYEIQIPKNEKERMTILYYLLFLMRIDGKISTEEEVVVREFGFRLGFRTALTSDLITIIKKYADQKVPPEEMLDAIRAYLN